MSIKNDIENDLKYSSGDVVHAATSAAISSIPYFGSPAAEIFNKIISAPIEKRKEKWMISIAESLEKLQEEVDDFNINTLCENELFISVLNRASQLAISNHQVEKLNALRNTILNTALDIDIDENEKMMFLNLVDTLTPWHIKIIYYFENPKLRFGEKNIILPEFMMGSPISPLLIFFPELTDREDYINLIIKELYNNGIFNTKDVNTTMTSNGIYASRLTEYGERFLRFIKQPM